ncbi:MAG TPA: dienelactone hydrolase family protein, partial [Gemmataceae bacterium]|nr:dienelactone hydrolase family protein [Gemmataceae bacterium]
MRYLLTLLAACGYASVTFADSLPNTQPLIFEGDPAAAMVAGLHKYLDRETAASVEKRKQFWKPDLSSAEAYAKSVEPNRERLRKILGVVDRRLPPRGELVATTETRTLVAEAKDYTVHAIRWQVLPGVEGEGLLLVPANKVVAGVVAIPDADWTPEMIAGLAPGVAAESQFARRLAENGCCVVVPTLIDRKDDFSGNAKLNRRTNESHREFVYRMSYEMGRHVTGYEVQKVLAAVDWLSQRMGNAPLGVFGYGEGGAIALYSGATDERIGVVGVSSYFGPREALWDEPIERNVWGLLREFGDAEIAQLIWPRHLVVESCLGITHQGSVKSGGQAAPGRLVPPPIPAVRGECQRAADIFGQVISHPTGRLAFWFEIKGSSEPERGPIPVSSGLAMFWSRLQPGPRPATDILKLPTDGAPAELRTRNDSGARQRRQLDQLVAYTQKLWRDSEFTRDAFFWKKTDSSSPEKWQKSCDPLRAYFWEEVIGKLPPPTLPPNPRTRQVYDEPKWTGHEVMLDLYPDVFAYGILLTPKDLKPGERRPVVVCQHGLEGTPRSCIDPERRTIYNRFAAKLADLGYVVYCPQNPYYGENTFRQVQRKANPLKLSLFSFIIQQHATTIDWLCTLPYVDKDSIAFYGLSYGGKTAMRVPAVEPRYCLSICSGDFNEWIGKNVSVDLDRSYMWTREYEMPEFDLGNTFNYAEMAGLIAPRPFMVERGHDDGVGTDEMVAYECAKVRRLYSK